MKKILFGILIGSIIVSTLCSCSSQKQDQSKADTLKILCTTFPIYQITRNIARNVKNISIELMIPANFGCPHDYTLKPQDMQKLVRAHILVMNGLGLEEFSGVPIKKANKNIYIIDSSAGIKNILFGETQCGKSCNHAHHNHGHKEEHKHEEECKHKKTCNHKKEGQKYANPHLFASPHMVKFITLNIANHLAKKDKKNAEQYKKNALIYTKKMEKLEKEFEKAVKILKNRKIIAQHGIFDYLARDFGLTIVKTIQTIGGQDPSASEILELISMIKISGAGAIFSEPQYEDKVAKTLAKETGIPLAKLDPVANGPDDAKLDYYEKIMRNNIKILIQTLKTK